MENQPHFIDYNQPVITVRDLYKSFGNNHVLRGVDLDLYKGENVVVLGRSGTGKSVLIKIISGLLKQDKGIANVLGQDVDKLRGKQLAATAFKNRFFVSKQCFIR